MTPPIELHRTDRGQGTDAFVFLHYFAGSARAWDGVIARIAPGRRCVAVDLRGFGDSPAPRTGYAVADSADDVSALVTTLGLERYVLVGHSMGGKIAMALAARRPPGLAGLVLVAPSPPTPEAMPEATREDIAAAVTRVDVPTLVVAGGEDPVMHRDMLEREVVARIAGARMTVVPGVGHLVPYEAPTQLAAFVEGAW